MKDRRTPSDVEDENEIYPVEPRYHPIHKVPRKIYDFLASARLAMALLIAILACCLAGVTVWRGSQAWQFIFNSLWFNAILVLMVINVACCFFGRIWGRRVTIVSFGMILFHLSFVVILLAIVYNSLFYFRAIVRITEGETLSNSDPLSYDVINKGRFFSFSRLKGSTTLIKMHTGYKVGGEDKRAAYEIAVGEEGKKQQGVIYITHKLTYQGVDYFNDKEGYSLLLMLSDRQGKELYGVHVPLQSIRLSKESTQYSTGHMTDKGEVKKDVIAFPAPPERPLLAVKTEYQPAKEKERAGDVQYVVYPLNDKGAPDYTRKLVEGKAAVGESIAAGEYLLSAREVRYWVGMLVRYEPGKPFVLASLWVGLAGMLLTTVGRMLRGKGAVRPG